MFEKVIGHENIKEIFKKQILANEISHAYVFYGIEGIGKKLFAEEIAKEILKTDTLNHPDYRYIEVLDNKSDIVVEQIKNNITNDINNSPMVSNYRVYVINDADKLNIESQNKLLKTLEEPPKHIIIILVTNYFDKLLPTIKSRTMNILFSKLTKDEILEIVKKEIKEEVLDYAEGSLSKVLDMTIENNILKYDRIRKIYENILQKNTVNMLEDIKEIDLTDVSIEYLEYLLMKAKKYDLIELIGDAKIKIQENTSEEMVKTVLAIKLCK